MTDNRTFIYFLSLMFMFMCGSMLGWVLEFVYRNFFSGVRKKGDKWINPGFLTGPCVPLYGFGLCALYLMSGIRLPIENKIVSNLVLFLIMAATMTAIEYVAGLIFIKGMKVQLWDYSKNRGNIQGIICPLFSFFWAVLSAVFYFCVYPVMQDSVYWFVNNICYSYFVGIFSGVFILDFSVSLNLMAKIRAFAKENDIVVKTEELKKQVLAFKEDHNIGGKFLFGMHNAGRIGDRLRDYVDSLDVVENMKEYVDKIGDRINDKLNDKIGDKIAGKINDRINGEAEASGNTEPIGAGAAPTADKKQDK